MTKKDREKIKELIKLCKIYRYSTDETLEYLDSNGFKISDRTLRRIKNEMYNSISERFLELAKYELVDELIRGLDALKTIEKQYWSLLDQNPTINERIKIYDNIRKTQYDIALLLTDAPMITNAKNFLDSRLAQCEELAKKASVA
jgi:hypothetical protein